MAKETNTVKKVNTKEAQRKQNQDDIATLEAKASHPVSIKCLIRSDQNLKLNSIIGKL